jgi:hypothetical protein
VSEEVYTIAEHYCKSFRLRGTAIVRPSQHRQTVMLNIDPRTAALGLPQLARDQHPKIGKEDHAVSERNLVRCYQCKCDHVFNLAHLRRGEMRQALSRRAAIEDGRMRMQTI